MLIEGGSQIPDNSRDAWEEVWSHRCNQKPIVPEHYIKRIARENKYLQATEKSPHEEDTYHQSLRRTAEAHIVLMSKECCLAEDINLRVKQTPLVFENEVLGSGLCREDVVEIMKDYGYQDYEEAVVARATRRDAKISNKRH